MNQSPSHEMAELLIQRSTCGLSNQEQQDLDRLQRDLNVNDYDLQNESEHIELAAAAADLACFQNDADGLPAHLKDCVLVEAGKFFESNANATDANRVPSNDAILRKSRSNDSNVNGWMVAAVIATAASILLLINAMNTASIGNQPELSVAQKLTNFLNDNAVSDRSNFDLLPGTDASAQNMTDGEIFWSDDKQDGFMTFNGLRVNDPNREQYQLWIFDEAKQALPVSGGVFNITSDSDSVQINPGALAKGRYWAVTVEAPGGVVKSDRSRIAAIDPDLLKALTGGDGGKD